MPTSRQLFYLLSCLLIYNCFSKSFAQDDDIAFRKINSKSGLSSNVINAILEDDKGFIWIGTTFGLNKFDGVHNKTFYKEANNPNSLLDDEIHYLIEDKYHTIWIATANGLCYINTDNGDKVHQITHVNGKLIEFTENIFYIDAESKLWMLIDNKLTAFNIVGVGQLQLAKEIILPERPTYYLNFITRDNNGHIWFGTDHDLYRLNNDSIKTFDSYKTIFDNPEASVALISCCTQGDSTIWFGAYEYAGLIKYNIKNKSFRNFKFNEPANLLDIKRNRIWSIVKNKTKSNLWIGSRDKGLLSFDLNEETFKNYNFDASALNTKPIDGVRTIIYDRSDRLWIGTDEGVYIITPEDQLFKAHYLPPINDNTPARVVHFVIPSQNYKKNHNLWIGTSRNGLLCYNKEQKTYSAPLVSDKSLEKSFKISSIRDGDYDNKDKNIMWLASSIGAFKFDINKNSISQIVDINGIKLNEEYDRVVLLKNDKIAFCTKNLEDDSGIILYDTKKNISEKINCIKQNLEDNVVIIEKDSTTILLSYDYTLIEEINMRTKKRVRWDLKKYCAINPLCDIKTAIKKNDTVFYLITTDGLWELNVINRKCMRINLGNDPRSNYLSRAVKDKNNNLWIAGKAGIICYNPNTKESKYFGDEFNLKSSSVLSLLKIDNDGNIYFSQIGMYFYFNPTDFFSAKKNNSSVKFNSFNANEEEIELKYDSLTKTLQKTFLNYDQNNIRIEFAALNFGAPLSNIYYYQLKGLSDDWINCGNTPKAIFTNLQGGEYVFSVKFKDVYGNYNKTISSMSFYIKPPFYKTNFFYFLVVLIIFGITFLIYKIRLNQLIRLERLRTKIATDLHDDIGSTLSSISIFSNVASNKIKSDPIKALSLMNTIEENSRNTIENMSDIIWTIKPKSDTIEELLLRMKQFATKVLEAKEMGYRFHTNEEIKYLKLNMELKRNIYLIFKEAINNTVKHAKCNYVETSLLIDKNNIILIIKDDGKGLPENIDKGNGLINMRHRAKECGGEIVIKSSIEKGTQIELVIPIP